MDSLKTRVEFPVGFLACLTVLTLVAFALPSLALADGEEAPSPEDDGSALVVYEYDPDAVASSDDENVIVHSGTKKDLEDFLADFSRSNVVAEYDCADPASSAPEIVGYLLGLMNEGRFSHYVVSTHIVHDDPRSLLQGSNKIAWKVDGMEFEQIAADVFHVDSAYLEQMRSIGNMSQDGAWWYYQDGAYYVGDNTPYASASPEYDITIKPEYWVEIRSLTQRADGAYDVTYDYLSNVSSENVRRYAIVELNNAMVGTTVFLLAGDKTVEWTKSWTLRKSSASPITEEQASVSYMYRLYNPYSGEHFYTANADEKQGLVNVGWVDEGIGWTAPTEGDPVYRVYNSYAGEHHYTLDAAERDSLVETGWTDEGVGWCSDPTHAVPLYREYNPNMYCCNHNYTTSKEEHDSLVAAGWRDEGFAWYGV